MVALDRKLDDYPIAAFAEVKAEATERPSDRATAVRVQAHCEEVEPTELSAA